MDLILQARTSAADFSSGSREKSRTPDMRQRLGRCGLMAWSTGCAMLGKRERRFFGARRKRGISDVFGSGLRVALVKQSGYSDLYSDAHAKGARALLESSWHRTGPLGLFTRFDAEFFIVRSEPDAECRVAEEKRAYGAADEVRAADDARRHAAQEAVAVSSEEVDWAHFDVVIAIENAVPARITKKHPGVLWATLLEHHRMKPFREYLRRPPAGYDAFLNLRFGPNPGSLMRRPHVIDWPYNLNTPGGITELYPEIGREPLVLLEDHQDAVMKRAITAAGCRWTGGEETAVTLKQFAETMVRAKVFCAARPTRGLGGLATIDAVAAGCAVIADRSRLWNPFLVTRETNVSGAGDAARLAARLLVDDELFNRVREEQDRRLAWFCWERPLRQLGAVVTRSPRALTAKAQLAVEDVR